MARRDPTPPARTQAADPERHIVMATTFPAVLTPETKKALTTAGRKVAEWTIERDRLIRQAHADGGSLREIGEAAGLSHTAVAFIVRGRKS